MKLSITKTIVLMSKLVLTGIALQCFFFSLLWADDSVAQRQHLSDIHISIQVDGNLRDVFRKLEEITDFHFSYSNIKLKKGQHVSLHAKDKSLTQVLEELSSQTSLKFRRINESIHVSPKAEDEAQVQEMDLSANNLLTITGKVTSSEDNESLPGVNVLVKGTTQGTVTDVNGRYSINVPSTESILVFSSVGYQLVERAVGNNTVIDVTLAPDIKALQEIVVVGYGVQRKADLTGSVASVKGEDLQKTPANTFVQTLQGKVAGVDIKAASNAPGGGIRIRIRGTNSINASSEPLYVIDGFPIENSNLTPDGAGNNALAPSPLSTLSPNDIASIEILKDASATAIYGARGANGVVLITTKNGQAGKAKIDFEYSANIATVRKKLKLANAEEIAILTNEWAANNGNPPIYDGVNKPLPEELGAGTDWQDEIFRTALTSNYNLVISGGTEKTKYLVSGSYMDQDGIIIESNFKRAGLKFNLDQTFSDKIKIGVHVDANHTVNDAVPSDGTGYQNDSPLWNALTTTPVIPVYDENGNYVHNHDEAFKILENPVSIAKTRTDITYTNRILSSAFADIEVFKGLTFRANFGADLIDSKRNVYIPNTAQTQALPNVGVASIGTVQGLTWLSEYTFTYKKEFGPNADHRLTVLAGYTAQGTKVESVFSETDDFFTNKFEYNNLGAGSDPRPAGSNAVESGLLSYIGRVNYAFKDKYMLTGTVRRDGSSKFGEDNKWGLFPSVGVAWRMSQEDFLKNSGILSDLKLRSSYGLTGNQDIGSYSSLALYNTTKPIIGGAPVVGFYPNRIPNPNLKWEKTAQFNVGVDAEFWDGKFNFTVEYYIKKTNDLLLNISIPDQSGYGSSVQNIGEVENKGVELSLGFNNSFGELRWNSSFNISFNKNKLVSLPEGTERLLFGIGRGESAQGQSIAVPGEPLGLFYGYHFEGIWQTEEEITAAGNTVGGVNRPGLPKYQDLNGDGFRQNDDDKEIIGDPNPDFIFGFSNEFSYRNFSLYLFINGSYGNEIADLNRIGLLTQPQKHNVLQKYFDERWTGPGTSNTIEAPLHNAGEWKNFSDRDIIDGSYLRVKTISLSYNLPESLFGVDWIRNSQVYIAGDNLLTITNYTGFDPEVDLYASSNVQLGVDNGAYPASKSIRLGIKLGF